MDDFDFLSQPAPTATQAPETVNINAPADDLFGGSDLSAAAPATTLVSDVQEDLSWAIENEVPSAAPTHSDMFGENTLQQLATASVDDGLLTNQSSVNESDSFSTNDLASPIDETMSYTQAAQPTGVSLPAASTNNTQSSYADVSFSTTPSPMEAFNTRRQQQLAEKDAEEKRKIDELRQQGKADLERWYQDRRMSMEQKRQSMKNEEEAFRSKALEKSDSQSCDWSKVVRLIDFTSGQQVSKGKRDVNRMKSVLLHSSRQKASPAVNNGS